MKIRVFLATLIVIPSYLIAAGTVAQVTPAKLAIVDEKNDGHQVGAPPAHPAPKRQFFVVLLGNGNGHYY